MLIDELENHIKIVLALSLLANKIISNDIHAWKLVIRPFWPFMANGGQPAAITYVIENGMISRKQRDA